MKIQTLNIRHGSSDGKIDALIDTFFTHDCDCIVLTEFRNDSKGQKIVSKLKGDISSGK